jgi:hypothetical protein
LGGASSAKISRIDLVSEKGTTRPIQRCFIRYDQSLHKAIERADTLYLSHGSNINPDKANPAALVHLLVKEPLKLKKVIGNENCRGRHWSC